MYCTPVVGLISPRLLVSQSGIIVVLNLKAYIGWIRIPHIRRVCNRISVFSSTVDSHNTAIAIRDPYILSMMRPSLVLMACGRRCHPASVKTVSVSLTARHEQLRCLAHHANQHERLLRKFASFAPTTTVVSTRSSSSSSIGVGSERPPQPQRPFAVLGVQQIAIGCAERAPLHRLWTEIFGLEPTQKGITIASENVVEDILSVGRGETAVEIDLMTPIDPEKSPKVRRQ
jgi:hypothetical protein